MPMDRNIQKKENAFYLDINDEKIHFLPSYAELWRFEHAKASSPVPGLNRSRETDATPHLRDIL
jgi:hypothetical protein